MELIGESFRNWILQQEVKGFVAAATDDDHIRFEGESALAEVNFYAMDDAPEIVELRIEETRTGETTFFLHFELEEETRARQLALEMLDALADQGSGQAMRVLLTCTTGMTTSMFAAKMNEVAKLLSVGYEFSALPIGQAVAEASAYAAVLLAPQVGHRRSEVADAASGAPVIPLPARLFASYDAGAAVRLVVDALSGDSSKADHELLRPKRDLKLAGRSVMLLSVINGTEPRCGARSTSIGYRVLKDGEIVLEGEAQKRDFGYRDVEDVLAAAALLGADVHALDAIAVSVPGTVIDGVVSMPNNGLDDYDLQGHIAERYGVPVVVENNARAAAIGCYVSQDRYDSVAFHTQRTGAWVGGQGNVVHGRALRGLASQSGELVPIARRRYDRDEAAEMAWSPEGMRRIVADYLVDNVCMLAPQAVYVACELVDDMDALRGELAADLPERAIPELVAVDDYRERSYLGVLALGMQEIERRQ